MQDEKETTKQNLDSSNIGQSDPKDDRTQDLNFNPNDRGNNFNLKNILWKDNKRKLLTSGLGIGGGLTGLIILLVSVLIPLKVESIITNLENHFFASGHQVEQREISKLFEEYVTKKVIPGYSSCGNSTLDRRCFALASSGKDPVSQLFNSWRQSKFETRLAEDQGLEITKNVHSGHWTIKLNGISEDIGKDGSGIEKVFSNSSELRSFLYSKLEAESLWQKVLLRFKIGRLISEKYGTARCVITCWIKDPLHDSIKKQKKAALSFIAEKVISKRDTMLADAIQCLLNQSCTPQEPNQTPTAPEQDGVSQSDFAITEETSQAATLATEATISSSEEATQLDSLLSEIDSKGLQQVIINRIVSSFLGDAAGQTAGETATKAIPIIGWINLVAQILSTGKHMSSKLKALAYIIDSSSSVKMFVTYASFADELHTGRITATEVGSFVGSLSSSGTDSVNDPKNPRVGGTASAEQTPLYHYLNNNQLVSSNSYTCQNGKPVPNNKLVCSEEVMGGSSRWVNDVSSAIKNPALTPFVSIAHAWNDTLGKLLNFASGLIGWGIGVVEKPCSNGLYNTVTSASPIDACIVYNFGKLLSHYANGILNSVINYLIPNPIGANMSGGRVYDLIASGADVSGNNYSRTILGGRVLSNSQVAYIYNQQAQQAQEAFNSLPLFARLFSPKTPYSLISKIAIDIPTNLSSLLDNISNYITTNPFKIIISDIFSPFSDKSVFAATTYQGDPFGIQQYGYTNSDFNSIGDPETYWNQNCNNNPLDGYQKNSSWVNESKTEINQNTMQSENLNQTDPCLLILTSVQSAGGMFNTQLLNNP